MEVGGSEVRERETLNGNRGCLRVGKGSPSWREEGLRSEERGLWVDRGVAQG